MRGLKPVKRVGNTTPWPICRILYDGSRIVALTIPLSSTSLRFNSRKNEDFPFFSGPLRLPPNWRIWNGVRLLELIWKGLREFKLSSLKLNEALPRSLSDPGRVRISIRAEG